MSCYAGKPGRIASSWFTSVVVHQDLVYAADSKNNQTQVFQHSERPKPRFRLLRSIDLDFSSRFRHQTGWLRLRSIDHDFKGKGSALTLSININQLSCCSVNDATIKVYSLNGELLQTYGTQGRGDAGQFDHPYISADDDDGSVLIVDQGNNRLQVMSEQGEFSVVQLQPTVSQPRSAVLFNNNLYVKSFIDKSIHKYKLFATIL